VVLEVDDPTKRALLREVLKGVTLPLILTDPEGRPLAWSRVGVEPPADEDFRQLLTLDPAHPPSAKIARLLELVRRFDRINEPVPVRLSAAHPVQGYIHFGPSRLQRELRLMPLVQLGLFLLFMAVGFQWFRYLKISEERSIWVGMAKETAHQLGTPLSALMGWNHLLREQVEKGRIEEARRTLESMGEDLARLDKVTDRFSKIGSRPELVPLAIGPVLERTVSYFHKRLPRLKADSTIALDLSPVPQVMGNEELLEWVFENLIKNGLDALGEGGGRIELKTRCEGKWVEVLVSDTGRGIPPALRSQIFTPGFTTKKRGWGLGLALTKRIVEEYHHGEIKLLHSQPGRGTTFMVKLEAAPG